MGLFTRVPEWQDTLQSGADWLNVMDRPDVAITKFQRVIELKPDCADAWFNLGLASEKLASRAFMYERFIGTLPDTVIAGLFVQAEDAYKKAVALNPNDSEAYNNLGLLLLKQPRKVNEAVKMFERSIEIQPKDLKALFNLGRSYISLGRIGDAQLICDRLKKIDRDSARELRKELG